MKIFYYRQRAVRAALLLGMACVYAVSAAASPAPPAVSDFVKSSLEQQPLLLAARADIAAAEAGLRAAKQAIYNPVLDLAYEDATDITKTVGISQTIDWGDKQGGRIAIAEAEVTLARTNFSLKAQDFMALLLQDLSYYQTAMSLAKVSERTRTLMQTFKKIAEQRYQAGDLSQIDLNLATLAFSQAVITHANMQSKVSEAYESLRARLGTMPASLPDLPDELPAPVLARELDAFLLTLPAVQQYLTEVQVLKKHIALRQRERTQDPTIGLSAGKEGQDKLIELSFSVPLSVRNNFQAEVDVAYQRMVASEQKAQQMLRQTKAHLLAVRQQYQNLLNTWHDWKKNSQDLVDQQIKLINQKWHAGDISATEYLLQLKQALDIQQTGLNLRQALWQSAFEWMRVTASATNWLDIDIQETINNED